ncbi:hypothetical protein [Herbaspirillum rubrisubalbicans]|nr:hypothetical protein [Herbaspirillum rubrisubalbicans]
MASLGQGLKITDFFRAIATGLQFEVEGLQPMPDYSGFFVSGALARLAAA